MMIRKFDIDYVYSELYKKLSNSQYRGINENCKGVDNLHQYAMELAIFASKLSTDPDTHVGAVLIGYMPQINKFNIWYGYNCNLYTTDGNVLDLPNKRNEDWLESKYPYVLHAEQNVIRKYVQESIEKGDKWLVPTIYVTLFPCNECAKLIVSMGIKRVIYLKDDRLQSGEKTSVAAKRILDAAGVELIRI